MTRKVRIGDIYIGGGESVKIQSMTNVASEDADALYGQISELGRAGCDIVRAAVPSLEAAESLGRVKRRLLGEGRKIPLVADIHFDYRLALSAIREGADKIRINPGNLGSKDRLRAVAKAASEKGIPIRVGVNSGSLEKDILKKSGVTAEGLCESALRNAELLEAVGFRDIVLSIKASDVRLCVEAYRKISGLCDYPLHIGITEAGTAERGLVKSAVGLGTLLMEGIGDTLRVSLTADPKLEVEAAKSILEAAGLRERALEIISCPTCGRTEVELEAIAKAAEKALLPIAREREKLGLMGLKVAIMGCAVNGPGEAREADFGVACGRGEGLIFKKGEIVRKVCEGDIVSELVRTARES